MSRGEMRSIPGRAGGPSDRGSSYLVTGGAGFIGSHLVAHLLGQGRSVTVLDDLSTGSFDNIAAFVDHPRFRFAIDSITSESVLDRLASEAGTIVHLAAAVGVKLIVEEPVRTIETNVLGTELLLRAARRYRAKVVLASTSEVYGKGARLPFSEEDDLLLGPSSKSRWGYAASKLLDEFLALAYCREHGLEVVILRLFNTVGSGQTGRYGMVLPRFVSQAMSGQDLTVYGDGSQRRCFCDVRDVVPAISGLAEHPQAIGKIFNVGSDEEVSIRELAERVIQRTRSASKVQLVPYGEAYGPGFEDLQRRLPDCSRLRQLLGWSPTYGLDETIDAVAEHLAGSGGESARSAC
jgi:UDP-glucose 4-epimerase